MAAALCAGQDAKKRVHRAESFSLQNQVKRIHLSTAVFPAQSQKHETREGMQRGGLVPGPKGWNVVKQEDKL